MEAGRPEWVVPVTLPSQHIGLLQGIFTGCLQGLQRDLQKRLSDPARVRCESAALSRLLAGLERGEICGPDEAACNAVQKLAINADQANNYAAVVVEHEALQGLLHHLKGSKADER